MPAKGQGWRSDTQTRGERFHDSNAITAAHASRPASPPPVDLSLFNAADVEEPDYFKALKRGLHKGSIDGKC